MSVISDYLVYAAEKEREKYAWDLWVSLYPQMNLGRLNFVPFAEFKKQVFQPQPKATTKTRTEIMSEMMLVVINHKGR